MNFIQFYSFFGIFSQFFVKKSKVFNIYTLLLSLKRHSHFKLPAKSTEDFVSIEEKLLLKSSQQLLVIILYFLVCNSMQFECFDQII